MKRTGGLTAFRAGLRTGCALALFSILTLIGIVWAFTVAPLQERLAAASRPGEESSPGETSEHGWL